MSVYATGDCHGTFRRFGRKYFPERANMSRDDFVIICGDFGGLWESSEEENYWLDWLNDKPWTTLWVDGNHENFTLLSEFPLEMWHGGMVHRIRPNILHLMRGHVHLAPIQSEIQTRFHAHSANSIAIIYQETFARVAAAR